MSKAALVLVDVEGGGVALVGDQEEALAVRRPAGEIGLQVVPGGKVADLAVGRLHVEMVLLVPPLVAGVEEALVVGKVAHRLDGADFGVGELDRRAAVDGDREDVEDAGLVAADQDLAAVRREGGAAVGGVGEKLIDRVRLHLPRRAGGGARAGGRREQGRDGQTGQSDAKWHLHRDSPQEMAWIISRGCRE
jgi:hypothetical protein